MLPAMTAPWRHHADRRELGRFVRFLFVGGLNTLVGYGLFAAAILAGLAPAPAVILATIVGVLFNYKSLATLAFHDCSERRRVRFIGIYSLQLGLNLVMLRVLGALGLPPLLAQAILVPVMAIITYLVLRRWVFMGERPLRATEDRA